MGDIKLRTVRSWVAGWCPVRAAGQSQGALKKQITESDVYLSGR
jgi:hypothetical protein